ncbi:SusC/RagA family TonB-linked outer membrane protein [uncultured Rikenella sp.]|uniref:SusC/RagA family TonB-linked outer membrane protein n=1 Tax=uncultured Rikenella sp. TaxID=368003 RepID=UPI002639CF6D|nr:SusC/RagA family TonB-linked outer membrane protein [uncultured Rikenella sp.]
MQTEAVTVTALGGKKQDRKIGYATTTVKGNDLARTNTISPINALQGKVAGLNIGVSGSSGLTSTPMVTLRGAKSLTKNNSPIYVIDGIVMENEYGTNGMTNEGNMYGNQLKNLNSADFESVTVLKGAAATSLYGSRGANGAIVITTKGGKARKGIGVEVNYTHEFSQTYASPVALQNVYGMGSPTNGFEGGIDPALESTSSSYIGSSFGPRMNAGINMRQGYKLWSDRPGYEYNPIEPLVSHPDNWKALFQTAKQDNVSVALTGGSEKATYRLSYSYTNMNGALPNNSFDRHSVNFRTNGKINDVFSVDFSMQYSNSNTLNAHYIDGYSQGSSFLNQVAVQLARNTDLRWFRDNYIDYSNWERMVADGVSGALTSLQNTLNRFVDNNLEHTEQTIISRLALNAQLTDWLDASASISYNYYTENNETKNWGSEKYRMGSGNKYAINGKNWGKYNSLITLHSNNRFLDDNLELDVRLINEIYGNQAGASYKRETEGGMKVPGLWSFANTQNPITVDNLNANWNRRNNMVVGLGGVINLSWKDQINLEVTGRNDWISSLLYPNFMLNEGAHDNYSVFYPSVNLSWVFSDTFHIDPNVISFGKLRASWGQVGSGTSAYATADGAGGYEIKSKPSITGETLFMASPNDKTLPNYDLKPEIQQSMEFGADIRFLNGAIGVDVAYYKINTKNQILTLPAIKESGVEEMLINAGNIQNQGWEISLDFRPIQTNTVRWDIGLLWSRNRGKIKELHPNVKQQIFYRGGASMTPSIVAFEGGAFGQIVAGNGDFGTTRTQAYFYDNENPNNPLNGKKALRFVNDFGGQAVSLWQTNNNMPGRNKDKDGKWYGNYYNADHTYDVLGNVEADFNASFTTNLMVNLPNNSGSLDFFAQIDGRVGGNMISANYANALSSGNLKSTLYGRDKEHGGIERVNYKGETVYNGMILDGVYAGKNAMIVKTLNGQGSYTDSKGEVHIGEVDLRGMTMQQAIDAGYIAPMLSSTYYNAQYAWIGGELNFPTQDLVHEYTYLALREITLGYNFPQKWIKHVGLQDVRISFSARNICYLYNSLPDRMNPESMSSSNPLVPVDWGGVPFSRNFSINLNLRF